MFKQTNLWLGISLLLITGGGYGKEVEALKDPTKPLTALKKPGLDAVLGFEFDGLRDVFTEYSVSSILISEDRKVAIINGIQAQEGSKVDGAEVVAIDRNSVTLSVNNKTQQVFMNKGSLRQVRP